MAASNSTYDSHDHNRHRTIVDPGKQKLKQCLIMKVWPTYIIVRGTTKATGFTLNTLPPIFFHRKYHVGGELKTGGMARAATVRARNQIFCFICFLVLG